MQVSDDDADVAKWLKESQDVFAGFEERSWLAWGSKTLLRAFAARVDREERAKAAIADWQDAVKEWETNEQARLAKMEEITAVTKGKFEALKERKRNGELSGADFKVAVEAMNAEHLAEAAKVPVVPKPEAPIESDGEDEVEVGDEEEDSVPTRASSQRGLAVSKGPTKRKSSDAMNLREVKGGVSWTTMFRSGPG
jgi:seryl-tRNA synthetase